MQKSDFKHVADVIEVPCEVIRPSKKQQRETSRTFGIDALVESIRARGQVQPALVRPIVGMSEYEYELVSGERRWRACTKLNRPLKVVVLSIDGSEEQFALSCVANNQQALTPMEICTSLWVLYNSKEMQHVKKEGRMAATARRYFGRGHQWAWGYTGLKRLDERLQPLVKRSCPIGEFIPLKIAVRLAGLPVEVPGVQMQTWEEISLSEKPMTVDRAQKHITHVKEKWAAKGKKSRGRPRTKQSLQFGRFIEQSLTKMDPILALMEDEDFVRELRECSPRIRGEMDEDLVGMIERLEIMRKKLRKAGRGDIEGVA